MTYQSLSPLGHRYRQRDYLGNRSEDVEPLVSYRDDVENWARTSEKRMHEHCQSLLDAVANPRMLSIALDDIGRRKILGDDPRVAIANWYPWDWLRDIEKRILDGSFRRGKFTKYKIPKPGKAGFRTIEVPMFETRIVARNLSNLLTPLLDPDFYDLSIGFRPKRSPAHGVMAAKSLIKNGLHHMVACDIRDAFGTVPKKRLLQILGSRLHQSPVMGLIEELLDPKRKLGIPQGLAISPICLNLYLDHFLDHWWVKNFPGTVLVRYADDLAIFCETHEAAVECYEALRKRIEAIGMKIKESQEDAVYGLASGDHVDWIGFRVRWANGKTRISLSESSWCKLEAKLLEHQYISDKGETLTVNDIASIGFQWLTQKAVGVSAAQVPVVAEQIRLLADQCGLSMAYFSDEQAQLAWQAGRKVAKRAQCEVAQWVPQPVALD